MSEPKTTSPAGSPEPAHPDRGYARQLDRVRERLLYMAGRVEAMIADSTRALRTRDADLARRVVEADAAVDAEEQAIDEHCLHLLALRQPKARDLRFITRAMKMVTDLERIADLAASIAGRSLRLIEVEPLAVEKHLPGLAQVVQSMVNDAIDAFVRGDARLAWAVIAQDDVVDVRYHTYLRATLSWMMTDPTRVEVGVDLQAVGKSFERMADHATNLAEQVVYLVEATDVRHREVRHREP